MAEIKFQKTEPRTAVAIADQTDLSPLKSKVGPLQRIGAAIATSRVAGKALQRVEAERVQAEARLQLAAIRTTETQLKAAMVSSAEPVIGSLVLHLNATTAAVRRGFTSGCSGEMASHFENRAGTVALVDDLRRKGLITDEEAADWKIGAGGDAIADIESSARHKEESRRAIEIIHAHALAPLMKTIPND